VHIFVHSSDILKYTLIGLNIRCTFLVAWCLSGPAPICLAYRKGLFQSTLSTVCYKFQTKHDQYVVNA
jgi:hypothetical protein